MDFYIAGKFNKAEDELQVLIDGLRAAGHEIIYDWRLDDTPRKPYLDPDNVMVNQKAAFRMLDAICQCDAFVLNVGDNDDLLGAVIECGGALVAAYLQAGKVLKRLYILGVEPRQSIFYTLPWVKMCASVEEILSDNRALSDLHAYEVEEAKREARQLPH